MQNAKPSRSNRRLSPKQGEELLRALKARFERNMNRHPDLDWAKVQAKLEANVGKLWSLNAMERTGGEPDVISHDKKVGEYDAKTLSWVKTPSNIRKLGGALFCDRRFDTVFLYHNGAESYYASRGFRGSLRG